eukprot:TRINITY_DN125889_c0_g1_i1.p2 TRINITY_DN125889_c0_g1~~TRINITY_DN125889_c0_g1_i1.p2  ORF type:complete len:106 (+),score=12.36 TRINITY_DN125889_c0_g1_i1:83-400(+)
MGRRGEKENQGRQFAEPLQVANLMRNSGPDAGGTPIVDDEVTGDFKYPELAIASPDKPLAVSFHHTMDPAEVASSADIRAIAPPAQPFDISAISVEASKRKKQME